MIRSDLIAATLGGLLIVGFAAVVLFAETIRVEACEMATASWYGSESGNRTANGEHFDGNSLTAAHRTLPFNTRLKVTFQGKSVVVRVNDRGPAKWTKRSLDLSRAAARKLGMVKAGVARVCLTRL